MQKKKTKNKKKTPHKNKQAKKPPKKLCRLIFTKNCGKKRGKVKGNQRLMAEFHHGVKKTNVAEEREEKKIT